MAQQRVEKQHLILTDNSLIGFPDCMENIYCHEEWYQKRKKNYNRECLVLSLLTSSLPL